jgi:hypothetical protein
MKNEKICLNNFAWLLGIHFLVKTINNCKSCSLIFLITEPYPINQSTVSLMYSGSLSSLTY